MWAQIKDNEIVRVFKRAAQWKDENGVVHPASSFQSDDYLNKMSIVPMTVEKPSKNDYEVYIRKYKYDTVKKVATEEWTAVPDDLKKAKDKAAENVDKLTSGVRAQAISNADTAKMAEYMLKASIADKSFAKSSAIGKELKAIAKLRNLSDGDALQSLFGDKSQELVLGMLKLEKAGLVAKEAIVKAKKNHEILSAMDKLGKELFKIRESLELITVDEHRAIEVSELVNNGMSYEDALEAASEKYPIA